MMAGRAWGLALSIGGLALFGTLSFLSKENGALELAYALVIELFCFGFAAKAQRDRIGVAAFFALFVVIPGVIALAYLATHIPWLPHRSAPRDFTFSYPLFPHVPLFLSSLLFIVFFSDKFFVG